ncbi:hypothetical protein [Streptomyces canus]|uniref:hypothetical protein n=1 Tax=Streptomyces canus TaxID=58343 RepID=UPI002788723F|nr:hypothetical protein [Streptomyces canus]MDQ0763844.1 hypothetical protein [Streptomyces canus]MDQ1067669.1 hypothetical protein [Streptomyces canus]
MIQGGETEEVAGAGVLGVIDPRTGGEADAGARQDARPLARATAHTAAVSLSHRALIRPTRVRASSSVSVGSWFHPLMPGSWLAATRAPASVVNKGLVLLTR